MEASPGELSLQLPKWITYGFKNEEKVEEGEGEANEIFSSSSPLLRPFPLLPRLSSSQMKRKLPRLKGPQPKKSDLPFFLLR